MMLTQFYNLRAVQLGFKCWNTLCALVPNEKRDSLKKEWKAEYKKYIKPVKVPPGENEVANNPLKEGAIQ